ncbi:hypothetical protein OMP38_14605 [Cohnella ginsengisoli]|uniref:Uncharacterized protein n=1 Tax=Cohnella ginsengisoli TaxID=425004 RepID=A0A9X4KGV3_9BACL|nr:hypothetical protein [Cohnella ginsengisoli]MDG0791948.1 hypothetical protein [Cohnella ginsengisoli]
MTDTVNKQKLLYDLDTQFVNTPYGAVSAKIKEIYNAVNSGKYDEPTPSTPVQGYREAQRYREALETIRAEFDAWNNPGAAINVVRAFIDQALSQTDIQPSGWYCARCKETVPPEAVTYDERHDERSGGCGMPVNPGVNSTEDQPGPSISSTRLMLSSTEEEETE